MHDSHGSNVRPVEDGLPRVFRSGRPRVDSPVRVAVFALCACTALGACINQQRTERTAPVSRRAITVPTTPIPRASDVHLAEPDHARMETIARRLLSIFDMASPGSPIAPVQNRDGVTVFRKETTAEEVQIEPDGFVRYLARGSHAPPLVMHRFHDSQALVARAERLLADLGLEKTTANGFHLSRRVPGTPPQPNLVVATRVLEDVPILFMGRPPLEVQFDDEWNVDRIELALWTFEPLTKTTPLPPVEVFGSDPIDYFGTDWVASPILAAIPVRTRVPHRWAIVPAWDSTIPTWSPVLAINADQLGEIQALARRRQ